MALEELFKNVTKRFNDDAPEEHEPVFKCPRCQQATPESKFQELNKVCPHCNYHARLTAAERMRLTADSGSFVEYDAAMHSADPLGFPGYAKKVESLQTMTGLKDAVITAECTRRIDQADHRTVKLFCLVRQAECLAIALRMRHCEIGRLILPEISALYLCQNGDGNAVQSADAADDRAVVAKAAVAVHLIEIRKDPRDIVPDGGAVFVPDQELAFPRRPALLLLFHCHAPPASCSRS